MSAPSSRKALGTNVGMRALLEVLLLRRHLEHADLRAGITAALSMGSVSADVVAVEAPKRPSGAGPPHHRSKRHHDVSK